MIRLHTLCPACGYRLCYDYGQVHCLECKARRYKNVKNTGQKPYRPGLSGAVPQADYDRVMRRIKVTGQSKSEFVAEAVAAHLERIETIPLTLGQKVVQAEAFPAHPDFILPGRGAGASGLVDLGFGDTEGA